MGERRRGWLKGCALGCGTLSLIAVLGLLAVTLRTCVPLGSASRARSTLDDRFGPPEAYRPAPDGSIPAERIEVFLDVRADLRASCAEFEALRAKMERVENLDEHPASGREVAGITRGFASVAVGIAPLIGEFFDQRNSALLDAGMGLGEYTYIFAAAYRDQLHDEATRRELFFEGGISPEVTAALRAVLSNQLAESAEPSAKLERDIRLMTHDPQLLPWADGLPEPLERSLAPYRERLDAAYCNATAGMALDQGSRRAMIIALY